MKKKDYETIYAIAKQIRDKMEKRTCPTMHCCRYSEALANALYKKGFDAHVIDGDYKLDHFRWNEKEGKKERIVGHAWTEIIDHELEKIFYIDITADQFNPWIDEPNGPIMIIEDDDESRERYTE